MVSQERAESVRSAAEASLLAGRRRYNRNEVAEKAEVSPELARRLWVSLGFPASADDSACEYTDADIAAIQRFREVGILAGADIRQQAATARTIGQTMARLAEWQVDLVLDEIDRRVAAAGADGDREQITRTATAETVELLESLLSYAWRRHLDAALSRNLEEETAPAADSTRVLAVGFADMVGYTRLTRHLHPDELSTLLEAFESTTNDAIAENGGWVVKNVGDEVMFAAESPLAAARIALALQESTMTVGTTPELRVALAYGPVLQRFGDLYGSVVNIAARLTGVARPGTILVDDGAAAELDGEQEFNIRHLRSVRVRGFNRLRPHLLRRNGKAAS